MTNFREKSFIYSIVYNNDLNIYRCISNSHVFLHPNLPISRETGLFSILRGKKKPRYFLEL